MIELLQRPHADRIIMMMKKMKTRLYKNESMEQSKIKIYIAHNFRIHTDYGIDQLLLFK